MSVLDYFTTVSGISTVSGIASLPISLLIFSLQQRLSNRQGLLSRDLGELELREKLGPIQFRVMELKTGTWRLKKYSAELNGALMMLKRIHGVGERLATSNAVMEAVKQIQTGDDGVFLQQVRELQQETALRSEFEILDANIEEIQNEVAEKEVAEKEVADRDLQIQGDKCQRQIRDLIETAERLGQESVYLLTDTRAVEAVYRHASDETRKELAELLWSFWKDPLGRLPAPATYGRGHFADMSLAETLKKQAKQIGESIENLSISK